MVRKHRMPQETARAGVRRGTTTRKLVFAGQVIASDTCARVPTPITSRPVARFADIQHIEQAQFEHEVLLVGSGGSGLGWVDVGEDDFAFGDQAITAGRAGADHAAFVAGVEEFTGINDLIAGLGPAVEGHLRNLGEDDHMLEAVGFTEQDAAGLGHALDHQRAGHDREAGVMVVEMLLGQRHVLHGLGGLAAVEFDKTVDPEPAHEREIVEG